MLKALLSKFHGQDTNQYYVSVTGKSSCVSTPLVFGPVLMSTSTGGTDNFNILSGVATARA